MSKLALLGGKPVRTRPFPPHITVGKEEKEAVARVIDSGILSRYLGCEHEQFMGGTEVQALEKEWAEYYGVRHAVAVNSATSGIIAAIGAIGIQPGDEVIVTPWSMCISATAPLFYGGTPIFADIEPQYFCLDPQDIAQKITPRTKAILAVDIFGQPYDAKAINALAKEHGLFVIEDCAQAPGATLQNKPAGTLGDIGIFSLNYHKHIHCGEGGVIVTNDDNLAERLQLIRNHAEAVIENRAITNLTNMRGYNFRMTELEAAVARCQLKKLRGLNEIRLHNVRYLEKGLQDIPCLKAAQIRPDATHVYYTHPNIFNEQIAGVSARHFIEALSKELPPFKLREKEGTKFGIGYVTPLYRLPIFQNPTVHCVQYDYTKTICPACEHLQNILLSHEFMLPCMQQNDLDDVITAFYKVWENRKEL